MIIDGRKMAGEVLARAKICAGLLARAPHIVAIVTSDTPATRSYLAIKKKRALDAGCVFTVRHIDATTTPDLLQKELIACVKEESERAEAVIVQLPLPEGVDTKVVCDAIPTEKDADVLSRTAREKFEKGEVGALLPPVVGAVQQICMQNAVSIEGKNAVVIGDGWLVGNPVALWLRQKGAEVTVLTSADTREVLASALKNADIVVSGAGSPHLITPDLLKQGTVLIDASTTESNGILSGDADPACAGVCSLITPVPGGVGPLAVALLFENAVTLTEQKSPQGGNHRKASPQGDALR